MFGEKLFTLRKEHGLSQEALAEQLHTTRQAISKWENGQGYPETEKLLMMSHIFSVSTDYLLKDTKEGFQGSHQGYYVSKEMAEGYLINRYRFGKYIAAGFFVLALAFIPYFFFEQNPTKYAIPTVMIAIVGVGIITYAYTFEEDRYKVLSQEPLLFDEQYLQSLKNQYEHLKKKYTFFMSLGSVLFFIGFLPLIFDQKELTAGFFTPYYSICIIFLAVGMYILVRIGTISEAYKLLAKNEEHTGRLFFKMKRKVRKKMDDF